MLGNLDRFHLPIVFALLWGCIASLPREARAQTIPFQPYSDAANAGCAPCMDTLKVLFIKRVYDIGLLIPEWKPVVDEHFVAELEGKVIQNPHHPNSCHVSPVDYSAYHYTHDFGFDVVPDPAYKNVLASRIYRGGEKDAGERERKSGPAEVNAQPDTIVQHSMHVEWESGLGASNRGNPLRAANCAGKSGGFFSAGHARGDRLWNWPTVGDWVHLEGQWIWDRGHPPARTEIHPIRFCAVRRNLPDRIATAQDSVFATRVDLFASGDGGALHNNRPDQPEFVQPVRMSDRDYAVVVRPTLPRPSPSARLRYRITKRPGNTHPGPLSVEIHDQTENATVRLAFPWKQHPDSLIFARTIHLWWDVPRGVAEDYPIHSYRIHFDRLKFHQRKEFSSRSEFRIFFEAGGQWYFLNDFVKGKDVLHSGRARTYRKRWDMDHSVVIHVPEDRSFRVHVGGWEADGINRSFGKLLDPQAPCTRATKKAMHKHLLPATPIAFHGCLDDHIGEVQLFFTPQTVGDGQWRWTPSTGKRETGDQCPCTRGIQEGVFDLSYQIVPLD
ncbi:MAG: hypothetical protein AAF998_26990 [Bacteroidota bacterium]